MKNVFFVINKEKVYAYIVSVVTIFILFFMSATINNEISTKETSTGVEQNTVQSTKNLNNLQEKSTSIGVEEALVSNDNILMENNTK